MLDRVPHQDKVVGSIKYGMQRGSCDQEMSEKRSVSADSEHDPDADAKKRNNRKERISFFTYVHMPLMVLLMRLINLFTKFRFHLLVQNFDI